MRPVDRLLPDALRYRSRPLLWLGALLIAMVGASWCGAEAIVRATSGPGGSGVVVLAVAGALFGLVAVALFVADLLSGWIDEGRVVWP